MKLSIVLVAVLDSDTVLGGILLKGSLGSNRFCGGIVDLEVHELLSGVVVYEDGCIFVALHGKLAFQLSIKSHFRLCHLVAGVALVGVYN
jgi:hypothetical protein